MVAVLNFVVYAFAIAFGSWLWNLSDHALVIAFWSTIGAVIAFHVLFRLISGHWLEQPVFPEKDN